MLRAQLNPLARACANSLSASRRRFSTSPSWLQSLPVQISGQGSGTIQSISVKDKPYTFSADTYTVIGGSLVAKDHGIKLGKWHVTAHGQLPTAVLVGGQQGNPNWESVVLTVRVQSDAKDDAEFQHFVSEVERRCPITQLFKLSGVQYSSEWVNEAL
ncbi:hypothetical protein NW754_004229 [Fusarium falciforme]|nr:hypothetical protein NW754_004229 [Fusarium falciforme]